MNQVSPRLHENPISWTMEMKISAINWRSTKVFRNLCQGWEKNWKVTRIPRIPSRPSLVWLLVSLDHRRWATLFNWADLKVVPCLWLKTPGIQIWICMDQALSEIQCSLLEKMHTGTYFPCSDTKHVQLTVTLIWNSIIQESDATHSNSDRDAHRNKPIRE